MDTPNQFDNPEPGESEGEDLATRRIDPSELIPGAEQKPLASEDAATVSVTRPEDPEATKVVSAIQEEKPPVPKAVEPPKPISSPAQPAASWSTEMPRKDNRTPIIAIIAVAVVALVCICACTAIVITALMMIPTY